MNGLFLPSWWSYPLVARWLQDAAEKLDAGSSLIVVKPRHAPARLDDAVSYAIATGTHLAYRQVHLHRNDVVATSISDALGIGHAPLSIATQQAPYSETVLHITCEADAEADLFKFLAQYVRMPAAANRTRIWTELPQENAKVLANSSKKVHIATWRGLFQASDTAIAAAQLMRDRPGPGPWRLTEAIVREVGGWDYDFMEMLSRLDDATLLDLPNHLRREVKLDAEAQRRRTWLDGGVEVNVPVQGEQHSLVLAQLPSQDLELRFLGAQISALLPWLENMRPDVLRRVAPLLRKNGTNTVGSDYYDLEYGDVFKHMRAAHLLSTSEGRLVLVFRNARNRLAHQEPLEQMHLDDLLRNCRLHSLL